jgi:N-glycosidase YbiA
MSNTDHLFFGVGYQKDSSEPINFLETRFQDLSPFSAHEVEIEGVVYKTAEHAYQALRVIGEARASIISARSPMDAWREGQKCKERNQMLPDLDNYALMEKIFRAKLSQHSDVREVLLESGNRELLKVYDTDYDWGTGVDGTEQNNMGKLWMKLREEQK